MKNITISSALLISLLLGIPAVCSASYLGPAEMFNAYAISSINYGSVDIEGVVGSAGDTTFQGSDVGHKNNSSEYSMYAGGNVSLSDHHVYNGGIEAGGGVELQNIGMSIYGAGFSNNDTHKISSGDNFTGSDGTVGDIYATGTISTTSLNTGTQNPGSAFSASVDHDQITSDILNASSTYAAARANGSVIDQYGTLIFTGGSDLNIFNVSAEKLSNSDAWKFSGLGTFVLNILGTELLIETFSGFQFTDGASSDMLIYNFVQAVDLDIRGSLYGTVLAPLANTYLDGSGVLNGSIYTNELIGDGQINAIYFDGIGPEIDEIAQVPAPTTLSLFGIGLLAQLRRNRKNLAATKG